MPVLLGGIAGLIPGGDLTFVQVYLGLMPCGPLRLLDIMQATKSAAEKYAAGFIITRGTKYMLEHPEVINQISTYISNYF